MVKKNIYFFRNSFNFFCVLFIYAALKHKKHKRYDKYRQNKRSAKHKKEQSSD